MPWTVVTHDEFDPEFDALPEEVRDELLAAMLALSERGPSLGRPLVDTLNARTMKNLKELRFRANDGVWRFAFAFDPKQRAIVLCGGDKSTQQNDIDKAHRLAEQWRNDIQGGTR